MAWRETWLNPPTWAQAGILADKLFELDIWIALGPYSDSFGCELHRDREVTARVEAVTNASPEEAIARAVLAMLEASDG